MERERKLDTGEAGGKSLGTKTVARGQNKESGGRGLSSTGAPGERAARSREGERSLGLCRSWHLRDGV